jgi:hypothetical protein
MSVGDLIYERRDFLQKKDDNGISLFDHLSELTLEILEKRPVDAFERLEELSSKLKNSISGSESIKPITDGKVIIYIFNLNIYFQFDTKILDLLQTPAIEKSKELLKVNTSGEEQGGHSDVRISNGIEEGYYFERLGIGLGQEETSQIYVHLKKFFENLPLKSVRLFGKIKGINKDYYIAEGESQGQLGEEGGEDEGAEEEDQKKEGEGTGGAGGTGATEDEEGAEEEVPLASLSNTSGIARRKKKVKKSGEEGGEEGERGGDENNNNNNEEGGEEEEEEQEPEEEAPGEPTIGIIYYYLFYYLLLFILLFYYFIILININHN